MEIPRYGLPRRIWRIIYPPLVFFAIIGVVVYFLIRIPNLPKVFPWLDLMWCQFIGELIAFAALFPMYRADSKKILDGYAPVVTSASLILLTCAFAFGVWTILTDLGVSVQAFNLFPSYTRVQTTL
ncbi:MAG: hypothetical protein LBM16_02660, partial [Clostridiales bacterium]|nr:hypothetical protein [Clostridiales bacterium]